MKITNKKAFGLVEIIVAIAIFGTAMIAVIALAIGSLRTVKDNELADTANAVMVGSLEYVKSPAIVPVLNNLPPGRTEFAFAIENDISSTGGERTLIPATNVTAITDCSESSEFRVVLLDIPDFLICNQVLIEETSTNVYEIRSIVVFRTTKNMERNELFGFRNTGGGV